jgi:hypothetical protein
MNPSDLRNFYSCTIESILRGCINAWYGQLHRPGLEGLTEGGADSPIHHWGKIVCHPGHTCQAMSKKGPKQMPKNPATRDRQYRCIKAQTNRLLNSFYPLAIRLLLSL